MKNFIGVLLSVMDERRHEIACVVVFLMCVAAFWVMLLVATQ